MDVSVWMAFGSMIVAACALAFTVWQSKLQLNREAIMLEPSMRGYSSTKLESGHTGTVTIGLSNNGLGPAKIVVFQPELNGKPYDIYDLVNECVKGRGIQKPYITSLAVGSTIPGQTTIPIIELRGKADTQEELDAIADLFKHAKLRVKYKSFISDKIHEFVLGD